MKQLALHFLVYTTLLNKIAFTSARNFFKTHNATATKRFLHKPCTLLSVHTQYENGRGHHQWECEIDPEDSNGVAGLTFKVKGFKIDDSTLSGQTLLDAPGSEISDTEINVASARSINTLQKTADPRSQASASIVEGTKKVLVVHIDAPDASTTESESKLREEVFGIGGSDPHNLSSQYAACSYNKLQYIPGTHPSTQQGTATVQITTNVAGADRNTIRNEAMTALHTLLGQNAYPVFDNVMFCLPPGTSGNWIGYAGINTWYSTYNDRWCSKLSIQMHEIGHNIGLAHSGEGTNQYDDRSCMMGYSYYFDDTPVQCFNGAKNYQLGWYSEQTKNIEDPWTWEGEIIGIDDYTGVSSADPVLVRLGGTSKQYFLTFNRRKGINSGVYEGANQIMIVRRDSLGIGYAQSWLDGKLSEGDSYTFTDLKAGTNIILEVLTIDLVENYARITISPEGNPITSPPTSSSSTVPSANPSDAPSDIPSHNPSTSSCKDSTRKFYMNENTPNEAKRDCKWVAKSNTKVRCKKEGGAVATHCPKTCERCDVCEDSAVRFKMQNNGRFRKCPWIDGNSDKRCTQIGDIYTCRETCGACIPPTLAPVPTPAPAPTSTCEDSSRDMKINEITRNCEWVEKFETAKRCAKNNGAVATHCPKTCGTCNDGCVDSKCKFEMKNGNFKSCAWVNAKNKVKRCSQIGDLATCRKTCGLCPDS